MTTLNVIVHAAKNNNPFVGKIKVIINGKWIKDITTSGAFPFTPSWAFYDLIPVFADPDNPVTVRFCRQKITYDCDDLDFLTEKMGSVDRDVHIYFNPATLKIVVHTTTNQNPKLGDITVVLNETQVGVVETEHTFATVIGEPYLLIPTVTYPNKFKFEKFCPSADEIGCEVLDFKMGTIEDTYLEVHAFFIRTDGARIRAVNHGTLKVNEVTVGTINVYKEGNLITTITEEQTIDCFLEDEYTFEAVSTNNNHPFIKFCSNENQTSCWETNPTIIPILFVYIEIHAFFDLPIIVPKGTKPCYTIENLKLLRVESIMVSAARSFLSPEYYVETPDDYSSTILYKTGSYMQYLYLIFEIPTPMCLWISTGMLLPNEVNPHGQLFVCEHNEYSWAAEREATHGYVYPTYIWERTSPTGVWLRSDFKVDVSKKYLTIYTVGFKRNNEYFGQHIVRIYKKFRGIFGTVKTPQGYPVYNAVVKDNIGNSSAPTDKAGQYILLPGDETNKIWGEKTINKTIPNLTAKEISELKEINADEP